VPPFEKGGPRPFGKPFEKGKSGNPAGRLKGYAAVARQILKETGNGSELVVHALTVFRDPKESAARRDEMHTWLSDRGLGRPVAMLDLSAEINTGQAPGAVDLSGLSDAELALIERSLAGVLDQPVEDVDGDAAAEGDVGTVSH